MLNEFKKSLLIKGVLAAGLTCFSLNSAIILVAAEEKKMEVKKEEPKKVDKAEKKEAKKVAKAEKKEAKKVAKAEKKAEKKEVKMEKK